MDEDPSRSLCSTLLSAAAAVNGRESILASPTGFNTGTLYPHRHGQNTGGQTRTTPLPMSSEPPASGAGIMSSTLLSAAAVLGDLPGNSSNNSTSTTRSSSSSSSSSASNGSSMSVATSATYQGGLHGRAPPAGTTFPVYGGTGPAPPVAPPHQLQPQPQQPQPGTVGPAGGFVMGGTATVGAIPIPTSGVFGGATLGIKEPLQPSLGQLLAGGGYAAADMSMGQSQMGFLSMALGESMRAGEDLRRKRAKEDLSQLSSEDKLERTRLQNKTHSRRSRLRKKMYEEQLKSEIQILGMYRDIVEEARDLISVHSMNMEAAFLYGNMAYERVLAVPPQTVLGKPLFSILHPEDGEKLNQVLKEALLGNSYQMCTFRVQRTGSRDWLEAHCSVTALPGRLLCIMKVGPTSEDATAHGPSPSCRV